MHSFGYGFTPPSLTYHITDPDSSLVHHEVVDIPRSTMMHDFAITDRDVVFWDLPVTFDLEAVLDFIEDPRRGRFPYAWTPDAGARIGVMRSVAAPTGSGGSTSTPASCSTASTPSAVGTTSSSTSAG